MRSILMTSTAPFVAAADQPQQPAAQPARRPRATQREPKRARRQQHSSPSDTGEDDDGEDDGDDDPPSPPAEKRYLTAKQLRRRYGNRSHMWIERRLLDDPTFPRPVYFGRFRFWAVDAIEQWERSQIAARRADPPEAA